MTSIRVAITTSSFGQASQDALTLLRDNNIEVTENPFQRRLTQDEACEFLADKTGVLAGLEPLTRRVMVAASGTLRAIARVGIGVDNVDFVAAEELGIKISNTPEPPTDAVAEMSVAALLCLSRKIISINEEMHGRKWNKRLSQGLRGANVLFIGYGRIGRKTAELLRAFRVTVMVCDPGVEIETLVHGEEIISLEEGIPRADVITMHASGTNLILDQRLIQRVKPGALLINSARGELVDQKALATALRENLLAGAWLDTFSEEPYRGPLCDVPNCLLTPHIATYTSPCRAEMELAAAENLLRDLGIWS